MGCQAGFARLGAEQGMRSSAIPHTELPGTSGLYRDYLYHWAKASRFYRHDPHDAAALRRAAAEAQIPDERRQAVVAALRKANGESSALAQLELPDTVAVVTGQQVGLFGGPCYTVYKALTAVKLAEQLKEQGIRAVPVFWLATEDHDFAEIRAAWMFDTRQRPAQLESGGVALNSQPVGRVEIGSLPLEPLRETLQGFLYADEVMSLVEDAYQPGRTFGEAFLKLIQGLMSGYGLVYFDPLQPEIRRLAAPLLEAAWTKREALGERLVERGKELEAAGYHAQVHFDAQTTLFFSLENGRREKLSGSERPTAAEDLSPNALLRPVMQDYLLPTVAYIGGPAEVAYFAQSQVLYEELLGRMPVVLPRAGFTLLDSRARTLVDRYHVTLTDCFHGGAALKERISARLVPEGLGIAFEDTASEVRNAVDRLQAELRSFDPTLGAAMEKSKAKILYQLEKNRAKAAREALRRNQQVNDSAAHLSSLVFPEKHLQERLYSILPFLARHGCGLMDALYEQVRPGCPDHRLLTID